jgi:hypothetical protein
MKVEGVYKFNVEEYYYNLLKKRWKAKLLKLWDRYGTNPIPLKDFKDDKNMRDWISGHFWRWGLLKRVKRGVYAFSSFGVKCVEVLKRQVKEEAMWAMKKEQ